MDPSEDIIDVLYRTRDRSSSPSQHTLSGQSSIAPPPPRNYEKELHDLRRQSLAHRGSHHLSDSVFHKQNFISPSRSFLPDQNRIRSYSGQHHNQSFNEGVAGARQSIRCRPHKSENAVDVDLNTPRSVKIGVVPKEDIPSQFCEDDLITMPNGTRQLRAQEKTSLRQRMPSKQSLHRTDHQILSATHSRIGTLEDANPEEEIYSNTTSSLNSDIYENIASMTQDKKQATQRASIKQNLNSCLDGELRRDTASTNVNSDKRLNESGYNEERISHSRDSSNAQNSANASYKISKSNNVCPVDCNSKPMTYLPGDNKRSGHVREINLRLFQFLFQIHHIAIFSIWLISITFVIVLYDL